MEDIDRRDFMGLVSADLGVGNLDPDWKPQGISREEEGRWHMGPANRRGRVYLDMNRADRQADGTLRVPRLMPGDAYRTYG